MRSIIGSRPQCAVMRAAEGIDSGEAAAHGDPVATVKLPDLIGRGAPHPTVRRLGEGEHVFRANLVG